MRKEHFSPGVYVHISKRGAHKLPIVKNSDDCWRFLKLLRYLNDNNVPRNWERSITPDIVRNNFTRPQEWKKPVPYVSILSYCLMDNHFHLLLRELVEEGIAKFMQRLCRSMAAHFNAKYKASGVLFQGPYKAVIIEQDEHLQYLVAYINVKNPLEKYPGGIKKAVNEFEKAYNWACKYPFSSTADFAGKRRSSILDWTEVEKLFPTAKNFKDFSRDVMSGRISIP